MAPHKCAMTLRDVTNHEQNLYVKRTVNCSQLETNIDFRIIFLGVGGGCGGGWRYLMW